MINLRTENGKHIVTHNGEKRTFPSLRDAIYFIRIIMEEKKNV